ncbi:MAG: PqqD family peptide modification chaperone, partial [Proteobacteria bacterium]|nr:PqqD family peptide modification chaperone [Pseudomonadota bacterium]
MDRFKEVLMVPLDEGLVLSRGDGRLFLLNYTGKIVWQGLAEGLSAEEVAAGLAERFQIPLEIAAHDVG